MSLQNLIQQGYSIIAPENIINNSTEASLEELKNIFNTFLVADNVPFRKRAYLKLHWSRNNNQLTAHANQNYFQTATANQVDGGKIRQFKTLPKQILSIPVVKQLVSNNIDYIKAYPNLISAQDLTLGMHFIRYEATAERASYSSPAWLHKDDEPLVFIHLVQLTKNAIGGDNLIADTETQTVNQVVRLDKTMATLALNQDIYHAVTPLGSNEGTAIRDVILFTVEPVIVENQNAA